MNAGSDCLRLQYLVGATRVGEQIHDPTQERGQSDYGSDTVQLCGADEIPVEPPYGEQN